MRPPRALAAALLLAALGCQGTAPERYGSSSLGYSAVLIGARILTSTGETTDGHLAINLESDAEIYRLELRPGQTSLFRVEPGVYRLYPTRNALGFSQASLTAVIGGRRFSAKFPRDILRLDAYDVRSTKVVAIGVLEAKLAPAERGQDGSRRLAMRLDAAAVTRRKMVEWMIQTMMSPNAPLELRDSAVSWTRALEQALIKIQAEENAGAIYKPSQ